MDSALQRTRWLKSTALALLTGRDMSRSELTTKLTLRAAKFERSARPGNDAISRNETICNTEPIPFDLAKEIESVADWCTEQGWLDESRYARCKAERLSLRYGASRISARLRQSGMSDTVIREAVSPLASTEWSRAHAIWERRFSSLPQSTDEKAKQMRYLQSRGFSFAVIAKVISGAVPEVVN